MPEIQEGTSEHPRLRSATPGGLESQDAPVFAVVGSDPELEQYRRILESSHDCIKVLDLEGRLLSISSGGRRVLEIPDICPLLQTSWFEFWEDGDRAAAEAAVASACRGGVGRFEG